MISFDTRAFEQAGARWIEQQERRLLAAAQKLTLDVGSRLVVGSPVDSGDFRDAWEIETPTKLGDVGRISNPKPYGPDLARGRSDQAPDGWIEEACEAAIKLGGKL